MCVVWRWMEVDEVRKMAAGVAESVRMAMKENASLIYFLTTSKTTLTKQGFKPPCVRVNVMNPLCSFYTH